MGGGSRLFFQNQRQNSSSRKPSTATSNTSTPHENSDNSESVESPEVMNDSTIPPVNFGSSCPRCMRSFLNAEVHLRPVKEMLCPEGHVLCRDCFIECDNVDGCWQCRTEAPNITSYRNRIAPHPFCNNSGSKGVKK